MQAYKPYRIEDTKYLEWLLSQACCKCFAVKSQVLDIVAAHQSIPVRCSVKGTAQKDHDIWAVPLCTECHQEEHVHGSESFWGDINVAEIILDHYTRFLQWKFYNNLT